MNNLEILCLKVLRYSRLRNYEGYSKFDALNSPILSDLSFNSVAARMLYVNVINSSFVNLRPLFLVKKSRNPKGIALFIRAWLFLYDKTNNNHYLNEAVILLNWLKKNRSPNFKNFCWGYNFPWQSGNFFQNRNEPNIIVSLFAGEAFLQAYSITKKKEYLDIAVSISKFITDDLPKLLDSEDQVAMSYVTTPSKSIVINNQALSAAFLSKIWKHNNNSELLRVAKKQVNYLISQVTDYGCWYYTDPSFNSRITHDNYHTGGILDALLEYMEITNDFSYKDIYFNGLDYYSKNLFTGSGAPKWMMNKRYPHDIHGSAQGIISFSKASNYTKQYDRQLAKIIEWTIQNLYDISNETFIYRKSRFFKWDYTLMRWCNAWMTRAISGYLIRSVKKKSWLM